jgi:hypothetical protein
MDSRLSTITIHLISDLPPEIDQSGMLRLMEVFRPWNLVSPLTPQASNPFTQLFIRYMCVHDRSERTYVPRESLGEEKIA